MKWHPEAWVVILPNPYDLKGAWWDLGSYDKESKAIEALRTLFGADDQGWITLISKVQGCGWMVDLPNPNNPEEAWIFVESFPRKRDAIRFVKKHYDGDSQGRIRPIDVMEGQGGPKDWSPTGAIVEE